MRFSKIDCKPEKHKIFTQILQAMSKNWIDLTVHGYLNMKKIYNMKNIVIFA